MQTPCRVNTVEHRSRLLTERDHPEKCGIEPFTSYTSFLSSADVNKAQTARRTSVSELGRYYQTRSSGPSSHSWKSAPLLVLVGPAHQLAGASRASFLPSEGEGKR